MGSSRKLKNLLNIKSETTEGSSDGVSILTVLKDKLFPVGYGSLENKHSMIFCYFFLSSCQGLGTEDTNNEQNTVQYSGQR